MSFVDPFTHRAISDATFDDRVVAYQIERELIADRLDYAFGRYEDAATARSQDYWWGQVETLRGELARYDNALDDMAGQADKEAPPVEEYEDGDGDDWEFAGSEADDLADYLDDYPDWWDDAFEDYGDEWEFDVDYEEAAT